MDNDVRVTFRDMEHSGGLETLAQERSDKLLAHHHGIAGVHVTFGTEGGHTHRVHVHVNVPGATLDAHGRQRDHEDFYATVGHTFEALERQLRDRDDRSRGRQRR